MEEPNDSGTSPPPSQADRKLDQKWSRSGVNAGAVGRGLVSCAALTTDSGFVCVCFVCDLYIYLFEENGACVCVCVQVLIPLSLTHAHAYVYIYIYLTYIHTQLCTITRDVPG